MTQPLPDGYLSPHFSLAELTRSDQAVRAGLKNVPMHGDLHSLQRLASTLEDVRTLLGGPVLVSSGYRSADVNRLVRGSKNSMHMQGLAADFICPRFGSPLQVCRHLAAQGFFMFDQLIYEGTWVHLGLAPAGQLLRRQVLTAIFEKGKRTRYVDGLPEGLPK